jgi:hypothetical protein
MRFWAIGLAMVSASGVCATAGSYMGRLVSEPDRSGARRATGLTLERRPSQKATVSGGGNSSSEAENSSSLTIQMNVWLVTLLRIDCRRQAKRPLGGLTDSAVLAPRSVVWDFSTSKFAGEDFSIQGFLDPVFAGLRAGLLSGCALGWRGRVDSRDRRTDWCG